MFALGCVGGFVALRVEKCAGRQPKRAQQSLVDAVCKRMVRHPQNESVAGMDPVWYDSCPWKMEDGRESSHVGRVGEGAESHPVRRETDQATKQQDKVTRTSKPAGEVGGSTHRTAATAKAVGRAGEDGKPTCKERESETTSPQADSADERVKDKPTQPEDSETDEKEEGYMELEPLQQILLTLERQRTENAERDAARAKENAERDAARAKEIAELRADNAVFRADVIKQLTDQRTDFVDRDAARARETADLRVEIADLRAETARGFQHMTMWFAGLSFGIFAVVVAIIGVGI